MNPLWKTRLCNFFDSKSGCRHGRLCTFAHGPEELREAPDFTRTQTSICPELLRTGRCRQAATCQYAHSRSELRMCDFHKTGTCMAGDLCRFAHEARTEGAPVVEAVDGALMTKVDTRGLPESVFLEHNCCGFLPEDSNK
eukprot:s2633_g1.t1